MLVDKDLRMNDDWRKSTYLCYPDTEEVFFMLEGLLSDHAEWVECVLLISCSRDFASANSYLQVHSVNWS